MATRAKFPGLQKRFEDILKEIFIGKATKSRDDIIKSVTEKTKEFKQEEIADLSDNFANYIKRAKDAGIIEGHGPKAGYSLKDDTPTAAMLDASPGKKANTERIHWESFCHFAVTISLSEQFEGRVDSLPTSIDPVKWGNPDLLMLRASPISSSLFLSQDEGEPLESKYFKKIDLTPECILSSIELKVGLGRTRSQMFQAISEAAANSRWANEGWLVFVDFDKNDAPLEEDILSLARAVEIGIIEMQVKDVLHSIVHQKAPIRPNLRLDEMGSDRKGILMEAQTLLKKWEPGTEINPNRYQTFLDGDGEMHKMRFLIENAFDNLIKQKGFLKNKDLNESLKHFFSEKNSFLSDVLKASLFTAASAAGYSDISIDEVVKQFKEALEKTRTKGEVDNYMGKMNTVNQWCINQKKS